MICCLALAACDGPAINLTEPPVAVTSEWGGNGRAAKAGDLVTIDYTLSLPDGKKVLRGDDFRFILGEGAVIEGLDIAVEGMRRGGRRIVHVPPHRHWGRAGYGDGAIPPNVNLTLDVRLSHIQ